MTFLNPFFLFFLPLAGVPVLFHLLNRDKVIRKDFPTLMFLSAATKKTLKSFKLLELLLLAVRILIIILLTLGFARPVWKGHIKEGKEEPARIILIDNSYTMSYKKGESDILNYSKELAAQCVNNFGGAFSVGTVNNGLKKLSVFTSEVPKTLTELSSINISQELSDIPKSVGELLSRLESLDYAPYYNIMIFSDFKRSAGVNDKLSNLASSLSGTDKYSFFLIDTNDGTRNKAVVGVERKIYYSGAQSVIRADIYSSAPTPAFAELIIDGVKRNSVRLTRSGRFPLSFKYIFSRPGNYRGQIRLDSKPEDDRVVPDNTYYFNLEVRPRLNILVADGNPGYTLTGGESYFLTKALNSGKLRVPLKFLVIDSDRLNSVSLNKYDIVFLVNAAKEDFKPGELLSYVNYGGGIGIFSGDNIDREAYNRILSPLLGIQISPGGPVNSNGGGDIKGRGTFKDIFSSDTGVKVNRYMKVDERYSDRALLYFGDIPVFWAGSSSGSPGGSPSRAGFFSLTAGRKWSDFPLKGAYPVFIGEFISQLSGDKKRAGPSYTVGDTLPSAQSPEKIERNGNLIKKDLIKIYPLTLHAGNYRLPENDKIIPVNLDTERGQYRLKELGSGVIKDIFKGYNYIYIPYRDNLYEEILKKTAGRSKTTFFLAAAFVFLLIEEIIRKKLQKNA